MPKMYIQIVSIDNDLCLCDSLPWQGLKARAKTQEYESERRSLTRSKVYYSRSRVIVVSTRSLTGLFLFLLQELCRGYPTEFAYYFLYCRSLGFEDKPDYSFLKSLFHDLLIREGWDLVL